MSGEKKKNSRAAEQQITFLVNYMINHKKFAAGKFESYQGRQNMNEQWNKLSNELNELGPKKNIDQWKKVWKNQKLIARRKASDIKISQRQTGNPSPPPPLTEKELKIISVIGVETSQGLNIEEAGFNTEPVVDEVNESHFVEVEEINNITLDSTFVDHEYCQEEVPINIIENAEDKPNKQRKQYKSSVDNYSQLIEKTNAGLMAIAKALDNISKSLNYIGQCLETRNNVN